MDQFAAPVHTSYMSSFITSFNLYSLSFKDESLCGSCAFISEKGETQVVFPSLSLQFLVVGPRLSPSGLGGITPGRKMR